MRVFVVDGHTDADVGEGRLVQVQDFFEPVKTCVRGKDRVNTKDRMVCRKALFDEIGQLLDLGLASRNTGLHGGVLAPAGAGRMDDDREALGMKVQEFLLDFLTEVLGDDQGPFSLRITHCFVASGEMTASVVLFLHSSERIALMESVFSQWPSSVIPIRSRS